MKENGMVSGLESIKLIYNEKTMRVTGELTSSVDGVKVTSRVIKNLDDIMSIIASFSKQNKMTVSELIDRGLVNVDSRLMDQGVVVLDNNKEYHKYIFDRNSGEFSQRNLNRMEQKEYGVREDFSKSTDNNKVFVDLPEDTVTVTGPGEVVVEAADDEKKPHVRVPEDDSRGEVVFARPKSSLDEEEAVKPEEETVEPEKGEETIVVDDARNRDMHVMYEFTEELQRLNPIADIRVGKMKVDSEASYRFYSTVPLETLVLPEGYYLDASNHGWITNKIAGNPNETRFLVKDLSLADETKLNPSIRQYMFASPVSEEIKETSDTPEKKENNKEKKSIKNLKISKKALAIGTAIVLLAGSSIYGIYERSKRGSEDGEDFARNEITQEDTLGDEVPASRYSDEETFEYPDEYQAFRYPDEDTNEYPDEIIASRDSDTYEESSYVDTEDVTQRINDMCISFRTCDFYDLVEPSEKLSMKVINDARNEALVDNSKLVDLMEEYSKYIFDGTIWFKDGVIKGYDYLSPLSKYTVLVSGQTILQYCHDHGYNYNYEIGNQYYTFDQLIEEYDERVNEVYSELLSKGRTY